MNDWTRLPGFAVEICGSHKLVDRGIVGLVTPDGSILWLAQEGAGHRQIVEKDLRRVPRNAYAADHSLALGQRNGIFF
ncbi:hypothetical protein [Paenarthrobacter sp. YIM B13468]|uniref:hypothetical protein n=1 Tax=Paenarthrobacter sp. YIM B13468 TaxID=3366295 RepID=UPI00366FD983